jgi:hypothetical protein
MIGKTVRVLLDNGESIRLIIEDKIVMGGIFDYKIFNFIRIRTYLPITYYLCRFQKESGIICIRAGQVKEIIS